MVWQKSVYLMSQSVWLKNGTRSYISWGPSTQHGGPDFLEHCRYPHLHSDLDKIGIVVYKVDCIGILVVVSRPSWHNGV